jgi:steroid 5-alpha reductase family enzyme
LHEKVVEVDKLAGTASKIFCWLVYSIFYTTMSTPFLCRLEAGMKGGGTWKRFGFTAIGLQASGLLLEAVADHQKMVFKSQPGNRNQWCNVGLWRYSTHPNYLGEQLFWLGAFLGALSCYRTRLEWTMSILGLLFISVVLRGARSSLGSKHRRKYGNNVEFLKFRQTHSMWGPVPWKKSQDLQLAL